MSRRRMIDAEHPAYDPGSGSADGRAQCRRCLAELPHPQAMFCSAACLHEFKIRTSPAYARQAVVDLPQRTDARPSSQAEGLDQP